MAAITDMLNRMFTQKVIVKRMPGNRLRTIDYDKLQSIGSHITGRFTGARSSLYNRQYYGSGYSSPSDINQIDQSRNNLYIDYESMDSDAILAAALDIYADECTVTNAHGRMLTINCDDDKKKRILYNLFFERLNIDFNLWHWIRSICKFGDLFIYLPNQTGVGVLDAIPIHPSLMKRDDYAGDDRNTTQFIYEGDSYTRLDRNIFEYSEIAHFRVLTDTMYLPYGKSLLEGCRKIWKQLSMMEDAMLIHRIMRAPERRIFKLDVGDIPDSAIDQHIEAVSNQMKKVPYIDPETGEYNLRYNLMNQLEDFFLPTRGGESATDITTLDGLSNDGQLEDIEYLRRKMLAYLKIPTAYLGYDEGVEGKGTLAVEDIQFARFIERIQKIVVSELHKIAYVHLALQGYRDEELVDFSLELATPSLIYERQKVDLLNEKVNLIGNLTEHNLVSRKWIYENIFNMSPNEWQNEQDLIIQDLIRMFREEQIKTEGNDPEVSGEVVGTPYQIISMQLASKASEKGGLDVSSLFKKDKRHDNEGRPDKEGSWEREKDPSMGRDPTGRRAGQPTINAGVDMESILSSIEGKIMRLDEEQEKTNKLSSKKAHDNE